MKKITVGFVIQNYNDEGKCISQEFVAGDHVDWEDDEGEIEIDEPDFPDFPMDMIQPKD